MNDPRRSDSSPTWRRTRWRSLSLRQRLLLGTGAMLFLMAAALSLAAWLEVRDTAIESALVRVRTVAAQLGSSIENSRLGANAAARRTIRHPAVVAFVNRPDSLRAEAARAALSSELGTAGRPLAIELRDARGRLLLADVDNQTLYSAIAGRLEAPTPVSDTVLTSAFRVVADSVVVYSTVARMAVGRDTALLTQWRQVASNPNSSLIIRELIGQRARFYVGNADHSLWSDLQSLATAPFFPLDSANGVNSAERAGPRGEFIAAGARIAGTPWAVLVTLPRTAVLAPVDRFVERIVVIALACTLIGLVTAWIFSRRIADPVRELTTAADGIAGGNLAHRVHLGRNDELGRLAGAFNVMAAEVEAARNQLEEKVRERTAELHQALEQLRNTQDALVRREKLATLGQLAGSLGHELRNPLGVMSNAVYYLEAVAGPERPQIREYLALLRSQIQLSVKLVSDLLEFSRTKPAVREPVSLDGIVDTQLARIPLGDGIEVRRDLNGLPPAFVDPVQIGQVVYNLVTNAVQAIGEGSGRIEILGASDGNGTVELHVRDSGPGIAPDEVEQIFEPLFTTKARGIGLGLAVSRSLARANGGDVTVESRPGQGARFTVRLPSANGQGEAG